MRMKILLLISITLAPVLVPAIQAETLQNNILFLLDCSHRMNNNWGKTPAIKLTAEGLNNALQQYGQVPQWGLYVGLRVFGDQIAQAKKDCEDSRRVVPLEWLDPNTIGLHLLNLKPRGTGSLAKAIVYAGSDFPIKRANNYLIVLTAGDDECGNDVAQAITRILVEEQRVDKIYFLGLNLNEKSVGILESDAQKSKSEFMNITDASTITDELMKILQSISQVPAPKSE